MRKRKLLIVVVIAAISFTVFVSYSKVLSQNSYENKNTKYLSFRLSSHSRLGNHLFELSALLGIARFLNRVPIFYLENDLARKMLKDTNKTSPGLIQQILIVDGTVPPTARNVSFHPRCCVFENPAMLTTFEDQHLHLHGFYYQSYKYFPKMRDELIGFLEKRKISNLPNSDENTHVTCVHIRRGDFKTYGQAPSDGEFVKKAIKFIERKEKTKKNREVVIFGDDVKFMKSLYNGSHISQNSPSDDLIYSRDNCDVVFVSAAKSTFGWWIGYFSKGNRVYYTDIKMTNDKTYRLGHLLEMDYYMPHWTRIRFSEDKETVIEN